MKIVLISLIITCCTYLGYGFSSYYRKRLRLYKDIFNFSNKLIVEINFSKNNLKEIIFNSKKNYGADFQGILNLFLNYLNSEAKLLSEGELLNKLNFIKDDEKQTIYLFFKSLGRYDTENQIKEIENFKVKFDELQKNAEIENKKFSGLYIKLGLMLGILISIILI